MSIKRLLQELDELEAETGKNEIESDLPRLRGGEASDARLRRMQGRITQTPTR